MSKRAKSVAAAVLIVIAAGLAFTGPGHRMLHTLGFTTACESDNCGN